MNHLPSFLSGRKPTLVVFFLAAFFFQNVRLSAQPGVGTAEIDSLLALALAAQKAADLPTAFRYASISKEKCEASIGKMNPQYATALHVMGVYYIRALQYEDALPACLEALDIRRKVLGSDNGDYAKTLNNVVVLFTGVGDFAKAKIYAKESLLLREKKYGTESLEYATGLLTYSNACFGLLEFDKAADLVIELLAIREGKLGKEDVRYYSVLNYLGVIYVEMGDLDKAVDCMESSIDLLLAANGQNKLDRNYCTYLSNLAVALGKTGDFERELAVAQEAVELLPPTETNLTILGVAYLDNHQYEKAVEITLKVNNILRSQLSTAAVYLPGHQLFGHLNTKQGVLTGILTDGLNYGTDYPALAGACYDDLLLFKGIGLSSQRFLEEAAALQDTGIAQAVQDWAAARKGLSEAYAQLSFRPEDLQKMEDEAVVLETRLLKQVGGFADALRQSTWQEVQKALKPGEAAIEFIDFPYRKAGIAYPGAEQLYAAWVVRPEFPVPVAIKLCFGPELAAILPADSLRNEPFLHRAYHGQMTVDGRSLADLLWSPLLPSLQGVHTVYYSPASRLHYLNIAAIAPDGKTPLAATIDFRRVLSTRTLALPKTDESTNKNAVLFGAIDFDADSLALATAAETFPENNPEMAGTRGGKWRFLRGSEKEVGDIAPQLRNKGFTVEKRSGTKAGEDFFQKYRKPGNAPYILHIATHGFALPMFQNKNSPAALPDNAFTTSSNVMMKSGLVLSGGNHAWMTGKPYEGMPDGILTSQEVGQLNLNGTELVVLSACETGLGEILGNEGVFGLQRAFKIAGAHYIIMSLWKVPDQETQELMTLFYKKWLEDKMTIPDAFRAAQGEMRRLYPSPYYWAGFVLVE